MDKIGTGQRSTFYFTIPFNPEIKSNKASKANIAGEPTYDWSNITVLVVEDEEINFCTSMNYFIYSYPYNKIQKW